MNSPARRTGVDTGHLGGIYVVPMGTLAAASNKKEVYS